MGLDQYAYTRENENQQYNENCEIAYWRKHNALQGWMENLYHSKEFTDTFNCVDMVLTLQDLQHLEEDVNSDSLPETYGFFYGHDSRECEYQKNITLRFINDARTAMAKGLQVVYSCSW